MTPEHRIAKLLARAGVASRREIERMIAEGRIALNGTTIETPATLLTTLDGITVDGKPVDAPEPTRLFLYNKPTGLLVTEHDPMGRPTIYDRLPEGLPRLMPVGRLDLNTEGLLLLTTDGGFKRQLELPATGVERTYRARAYGDITQAQLEELIHGIEIDGIRYGQIDANLERRTGANVWIELTLREGKNREVRRVLEHLGLQVSRLIRLRYGPFVLDELPVGEIGEVKGAQIVEFRKTLLGGIPADAIRPKPRDGFRAAPTAAKSERSSRPARSDDEKRAPRDAKPRGAAPTAGRARPGTARTNDRPDRAPREERSFRSARPTDGDRSQRGERPFRTRSDAEPSGRADRDDRPTRGERPFRTRPDGAASSRGGRDDRSGRGEGSFRPRFDAGASRRSDRDERPARGDRPFLIRSDSAASGRDARAERPAGGERSFRPRADSAPSGRGSRDDRSARTDRPTRGDRPAGDRPSRGSRNSPGGDGRPSGGGRNGRPGGGGSRPGRPGGHR